MSGKQDSHPRPRLGVFSAILLKCQAGFSAGLIYDCHRGHLRTLEYTCLTNEKSSKHGKSQARQGHARLQKL